MSLHVRPIFWDNPRIHLYAKALERRARRQDPRAWDRVQLARARGAALNRERRKR